MFKLSPEAEAHLQACRELEMNARSTFAAMTDSNLVSSAKYWMQHCVAPERIEPDRPVYDSTFWHIIVPELLKRLSKA